MQDAGRNGARAFAGSVLLLIAFLWLRLLVVPLYSPVVSHSDSGRYLQQAKGTLDGRLIRAPVYPYFLRICGLEGFGYKTLYRVTGIQWVVSGTAFAFFALGLLLRILKTRGMGGFAILLSAVLSISMYSGPWDSIILAESLGVSLFFLLLVLLISFGDRPTPIWCVVGALLLILMIGLRDAGLLIPGCLIPWGVWAFRSNWRDLGPVKKCLGLLGMLALIAVPIGGNRIASIAGRDVVPLGNVLSVKVFGNPANIELFETAYGMPTGLGSLAGKNFFEGWNTHKEYVDWLGRGGRSAYESFLIHHPGFVISQFGAGLKDRVEEIATSAGFVRFLYNNELIVKGNFRPSVCRWVTSALVMPALAFNFGASGTRLHEIAAPILFWTAFLFFFVTAALFLWRERAWASIQVCVFMLLTIFTQSFVVSLFDAMEDRRHALLADGLIIVLMYLSPAIILDRLADRKSRKEKDEAS